MINSFIYYSEKWKTDASKHNSTFHLTNNTHAGFVVTLKATLELLDFLKNEKEYEYLMTNCLCSDPVEVSTNQF